MSDRSGQMPLALTYRLLGKGVPPRRLTLEVPGWGGTGEGRADGAMPQPAHCLPFIEGATYGMEFIYPFKTECRVTTKADRVTFDGDFGNEMAERAVWPPFQTTNPGHYSLISLIDLKVPDGFSLRLEPHPRFFNDRSGQVPAAVIGHVRTHWWPMFIFVTFKAPLEGECHVFRYGEPYAQAIVVPSQIEYGLQEMDQSEADEREKSAQALLKQRRISPKNQWTSPDGLQFDDLYRRLKRDEMGRSLLRPRDEN